MATAPNPPAPEQLSTGKWIARVILAVIVGEAIWGLLVSLTSGLIVPGLARVMGGDPQSAIYLGKGDFNLTAIFISVLELCLAGLVGLILYQSMQPRVARVRVKTVKVKTVAAKSSMPSIAPASFAPPSVPETPSAVPKPVAPLPPVAAPAPAPVATVAAAPPPPPQAKPAPVAAPAKPSKPKKPAEVYYNIVGEPINPTEDDS
jgi:hypothetical protein